MGLKPWEFDQTTPDELADMVQGYLRRQAQEYERFAWALCHYYNWNRSKKGTALTTEKLLGPSMMRFLRPSRPAEPPHED